MGDVVKLRVLCVSALLALAFAVVGAAAAGTTLKISLIGQSRTIPAGGAWAFYLRAWQNGKPWHGIVSIAVVTPKGKTVDNVGRFAFPGSLLSSYVWNHADRGRLLDFTVTMLQNRKTVGTATYPVRVT
jgi:hypothetical protein